MNAELVVEIVNQSLEHHKNQPIFIQKSGRNIQAKVLKTCLDAIKLFIPILR